MRKLFYLISALFGGVVALLLAPRKGRDMRNRIKKGMKTGKWDELTQDAKLMGKEVGAVVDEIKESEEVQQAVKKGKKELSKILKKAQEEAKELGERAKGKISKEAKALEKKVAKKSKEVAKKVKRVKRKITK